jgi:hypothetical protein
MDNKSNINENNNLNSSSKNPLKEIIGKTLGIDLNTDSDTDSNTSSSSTNVDVEEVEFEDVKAIEAKSKYTLDENKIDAYLQSVKPSEQILQIAKGGNFVSAREKNIIYIPLSLIKA